MAESSMGRSFEKPSTATKSNSGNRRFLGNWGVGRKLGLIALALLIPSFVLLTQLVLNQNQQIATSRAEIQGIVYVEPLKDVLRSLQEQRSYAAIVRSAQPTEDAKQKREEAAKKVTVTLDRLTEVDQKLGAAYGTTELLTRLRQDWVIYQKTLPLLTADQSNATTARLISDSLQPLFLQVGNRSGLLLDPDLDSYYAVDLVISRLPFDISDIAFLRVAALTAAGRSANTESQLSNLAANFAQAQRAQTSLERSLGFALDASELTRSVLGQPAQDAKRNIGNLLGTVEKNVMFTTTPSIGRDAFFKLSQSVVSTNFALYDAAINDLKILINNRIGRLQRQQLLFLAFAAVALALTGLLVFFIAQAITRPVSQLAESAQRLASGDFSAKTNIVGKDELGQLANTFNQTILELEAKDVADRAQIDASRSLQHNIGDFLNVTMDISQGNLTRRGKVSEDVLGNVVDAINVMTEEIGYLLKDVERVAQQVNSGSEDVNTTNNAILQGAQSQSEIAQKARAQALEVTQSIRAMAQKALETAQASQQTLQASQAGQAALQETLSGMQNIRREVQGISKSIKSLSDRSLEISEITETISGIASQTNMLALNAAIEASGAGEAGARFAIVADEVRKLAEDSARATNRVTNLIKNIQNEIQSVVIGVEGGTREVEQGYKIATQAGERLKEISVLANQSAVLVQTISSATRAQAGGVEQVKNAVEAIAQSASQAEAQSNQGRESAAELRKLSTELTSSLSRFQLPS
jgi:twitching motility protein PilJ